MSTMQTRTFGPVELDDEGYAELGTMTVPMLGGTCDVETFYLEPEDAAEFDAVMAAFTALGESDRAAAAPRVLANCRNFVNAVGGDDALREISGPDEIWAFVNRPSVCIQRAGEFLYATLTCECEWDVEHGVQLVYRHGRDLVRVSSADGNMEGPDE